MEQSPEMLARTTNSVRTCPDCGWSGAENFCGNCGEEMEPYIPKVGQFFHELLSEFLALDSKVVRTIPGLFRPGFLTKEYLAGRRKRYLLPSRLYFLLAVLCFFVLRTSLPDLHLSKAKGDLNVNFQLSRESQSTTPPSTQSDPNERSILNYYMEVTPYVILITSTPLFALILKWLYRRKKVLYAEHLIFSFHFFTFAILIFSAAALIGHLYWLLVTVILFQVYLYFALRNAYRDRGWGLALRFISSSLAYTFLSGIGVLLSIGVTYAIAGVIPG